MADLRIVDAPLLSTVKGTEKLPTGGEGNFSVSIDQVADFAKLKWFLATEGYVDNAVGNVQADLNLHKNNELNPHQVTKDQVGLGNVDNTADLDKPVSNATQSAIIAANSGKADKSYVDSQDQLKADKTYVDYAVGAISTDASKQYATLALATADIANIAVNQNVFVSEAANGGYWYKATAGATTLTRSPYDPLTQAKKYTDEKNNENNPNLLGVALTGLTSKTLDANEAKYKILFLSGVMAGECTVNFPKQRGIWEVRHQAVGGDILLKTLDSSLPPIRILSGQLITVLSDGTNLLAVDSHKLNAVGGTLTNATANTPSASTTLGVATVQFVNRVSGAALYIGLTGDKLLTVDEQAYKSIIFTGALTTDVTIEFPLGSGHWVVSNQTTGGKSLKLKCTGQLSTQISLDDNGYYEVMASGSVIRFVQTEKQTRSAIISLTGLTEKTLSTVEAKKEILFFGGTLTQDITVNFPKQAGQWIVRHQGTAGFKIKLKTLDSTDIAPVSLTNGQTVNVVSDGINLHVVDIQNRTGEHKGDFEVKATYYQNDIVEHGSGTYKVTAQQVFNAKNPMTSKSFAKVSSRPINNKKIAARSVDTVDLATVKEIDGMSKDGMTLYSRSPYYSLFASKDFGATWNPIFTINGGEFGNIIEELDNGELLLSYAVYGGEPLMRRIYVTEGYDFGRGASPTLVEVLSSTREKNYWNNNWGCNIYGSIILLTEYGRKYDPAKTPDGSWTNVQGENARYVWMSTDFGKTWTVIFDLNLVTSGIGVHMHSAVYDYVWNRIWVHFGDAAFNRNGMLYSDDLGKTWTWALQNNAPYINWNQSTSTVVLPDCILFGSDSAPNGIYRLDRSQGKIPINGYYEVEVAYKIPDTSDTLLNSVCYKAVRARHSPDQPYLFGFAPEIIPSKGCIIATYDGYTFFEVWRDSEVRGSGYGIRQLIGVTPQNEIIATNFDQRYGAGTKTQLRIKV